MSDVERVRIDVLGPIRAHDAGGNDVTPDGVLQRRLLAYLVLRRDRLVSVDSAIDVLWPTAPPRDPVAALQNHVFRLRRGLPEGVVESFGDGYRVASSNIDLDADRLVAALTAPDPSTADVAALDDALERWQGPAYPELDEVDEGRVESMRLAELRVRAREVRAERLLAAGVTEGLVGELAALADEEPLRERPRELQMTVLARAGRIAEALRVYDDFRRRLGDELGIEPSPALAAQHAELLAGTGAAAWAPTSRLPIPTTSLIGRDDLIADVTDLVDDHRLVTMIGPGGVGKTRLLVEVGRRLRTAQPDRAVVMCELATASADSVVDAVAAALDIEGRPGVGLPDRLATVLADSEIVLLLDNCEHVIDAVADLVQRLLVGAPQVTVVATSRERLRVAGEQLCAVPALDASDVGSPAVQLFLDRAQAARPGFAPTADELAVIVDTVGHLDGLPLAVELAAARLHMLEVGEIADGLERRFDLLSSGYRTSSRHRSLGAAISWSFGLLDDDLQHAFCDLSVFAGPFTVEDAAAVCGLDAATTLTALHQLVERSLVMRAPARRYVLLETLRAFGADKLTDDGRIDAVGERHARHQLEWAVRANQQLFDPTHADLATIDAAIPELRAAFGWFVDGGQLEQATRLLLALYLYGFARLRIDVLAWSERVTASDPEDRSPIAGVAWALSAYAAWMAGDVVGSTTRVRRALLASQRAGGRTPTVVAIACGNDALFDGRLDDAGRWYRSAVGNAEDASMRLFAASTELLALGYAGDPTVPDRAVELLADVGDAATYHAAYAWYCAGEAELLVDPERARARFARALDLAEATNAAFVTGVAGASKASIDARLGDPLAAAEDYRRLLMHWRRAGVWSTQWTMLRSIVGLLDRLGRARAAAVLLGAVQSTEAGHRIFGADEAALSALAAELRVELGDTEYTAAISEGATLDGEAAVDHALHAL